MLLLNGVAVWKNAADSLDHLIYSGDYFFDKEIFLKVKCKMKNKTNTQNSKHGNVHFQVLFHQHSQSLQIYYIYSLIRFIIWQTNL